MWPQQKPGALQTKSGMGLDTRKNLSTSQVKSYCRTDGKILRQKIATATLQLRQKIYRWKGIILYLILVGQKLNIQNFLEGGTTHLVKWVFNIMYTCLNLFTIIVTEHILFYQFLNKSYNFVPHKSRKNLFILSTLFIAFHLFLQVLTL